MARFWPIRNLTNFAITVVGISGIGYYGYGVYREQYFTNPVIAQAIKVLGKNEKVKEMLGYPLSYQSSNNNKFNQTGDQLYYSFKVMGPRGATQVEVTATQLKAKDVYEYDNQIQPLKAAFAKYNQLKKQMQQKQKKVQPVKSSSSWFGGANQIQHIQSDQILKKQKQLEEAHRAVQQIINQRKLRKNQFCIPQKQYYADIVSQNGKNNQKVLPQQSNLYKLQNIACQLPNKARINVLNSGKMVLKTEDFETVLQQNVNFGDFKKPTYGPMHQKLSINVSELSDEEIQQYSKHKTSFMYQKYNQYRIMAFMVFVIGSGAAFVYISRNKTKSMSNSVLYQLIYLKLKKDNKIAQFLKKNNLKQIELDKNVGGGMKNNAFKCQIGVNNVTMGRIEIQGKRDTQTSSYNYDKFIFRYVENNQNKEIDLLK